MSSIKNKFILSTVLIFSIFTLITAYFIQYILGHEPCNLCLIERIPYFTAVALISLVFFLNKYEKLISLIVGLFFILWTLHEFSIHRTIITNIALIGVGSTILGTIFLLTSIILFSMVSLIREQK